MIKSRTIDIFNLYAKAYDEWIDSPKGRVLFNVEFEAVRLLRKDL